jgi:putative membrane protein
MDMKTLRIFFLMALAVIALSCNNPSNTRQKNNRNKGYNNEKQDNKSNNRRDTVSSGSMIIGFTKNNQDKDEDFVKEAISGGLMEVELGKYAEQNAQDPRVKKFGSMMVKDHSKVNEELKTLAQSVSVEFGKMDDNHRDKLSYLQKKQGEEFDEAYMKEMVNDHEKDVDKFSKEAEDGKNEQVKSFASKTLPVLLMHLDSAKAIKNDLK